MQNGGIDLLFPLRAIEPLRNLRSDRWEGLVSNLVELPENSPERIAFVLLMVRISGCTTCQSDSFRAMRGCVACAMTTIKRYKGSDQNLIDLYDEARMDIDKYMKEIG